MFAEIRQNETIPFFQLLDTLRGEIERKPELKIDPQVKELSDMLIFGKEMELIEKRLNKDLREAARTLGPDEARFLVDLYYTVQKNRIRVFHQLSQLVKAGEPSGFLLHFFNTFSMIEAQIKAGLDLHSKNSDLGRWCNSIVGIGPVITSGLMAHIDITRCNTAGKLWRFAGLDPTCKWEKGKKRPWNATLKTLAVYKMGESFIKTRKSKESFYGPIYFERKQIEQRKNEAGDFADQAAQILAEKRIGKDTDAYKFYSEGKLPPAHINARARRYAVRIFLSHYQMINYELHYKEKPPKPFAISILGHADMIYPPNMELVGLKP